MIGKISLYAPYNADRKRLSKISRILRRLSKEMNIPFEGPIYRGDNRICAYYEDRDVRVFIYVDDPERDVNFDKVEMTIRIMTIMAAKQHVEKVLEVVG